MEVVRRVRGLFFRGYEQSREVYNEVASFRTKFQEAARVTTEITNEVTLLVSELDEAGRQIFLPSPDVVAEAYAFCEGDIDSLRKLRGLAACVAEEGVGFDDYFENLDFREKLDISYRIVMANIIDNPNFERLVALTSADSPSRG